MSRCKITAEVGGFILCNHYFNRCPGCEETTTESLVFISSDRKHDHHAVQHFTAMALTHLREQRGLTISHVIQWPNGCSSQYKSKGPFADIARSLEDLDTTLERNFYSSRHGKGPSDGECAVVKHHAAAAVAAGRAVISNATDLFKYCKQSPLNKQPPREGCAHHLRTFFWVSEGDVNRNRPERQVNTVKGTRSFHAVKCVQQNQMLSRHPSCSCELCHSGVGNCLFLDVVGP